MPPKHEVLSLRLRENFRLQFPYPTDFLRYVETPLMCEVFQLEPSLILHWKYNIEQIRLGNTWECTTVWLHSAAQPNGAYYAHTMHQSLQEAINILAQNKESTRHTLLVSENGLCYNPQRIGGDHQVCTSTGNRFTFSVWRDRNNAKVLLAIAWDQ